MAKVRTYAHKKQKTKICVYLMRQGNLAEKRGRETKSTRKKRFFLNVEDPARTKENRKRGTRFFLSSIGANKDKQRESKVK